MPGDLPEIVDLHTHVIPGVDDGAPDLERALETLRIMRGEGVTAVVATPHLNASNPSGTRRHRADQNWPELVQAAREEIPDLELYRGFEILLDTPDFDLDDDALRLAGSRYALVEFHAFTIPTRSAEALGRIREIGYVPVLAHPERYFGYDRECSVVPSWRAAGAVLQLNAGSLQGEFGERIREIAHLFLQQGWVDVIASDNHGHPGRRPSLRAAWDYLAGRDLAETARTLLATNPRRVLDDETLLPVDAVELNANWISRLVRAFRGEP